MVLRKFLWIAALCLMFWIMENKAQSNVRRDERAINNLNRHIMNKVEKSLLTAFGLKESPKVEASRVQVPPYMLHLYNLQMNRNLQEAYEENSNSISEVDPDSFLNTVRSYVHEEDRDDSLNPTNTMVLQFNVSRIPENEIIIAVELRITHDSHTSPAVEFPFVNAGSQKSNKKLTKKDLKYLQRLRIYDILRPSRDENEPIYRLLDTSVVDSRTSGTVKFDVAPAVKRWMKNIKRNYGLYLEVSPLKRQVGFQKEHLHIRLKRHVLVNRDSIEEQQPLLLIHSDDGKIKPRTKRQSTPPYKRYVQHCQRHTLRVDFRKVEWTNWIVAPAGYDAYYCQGECQFPLAEHMNATNHAVVQTLVHSRYPSRVPSACCVPTVHTAISMLYVDEDERVVLKNYQDMVVEACGCR